MATDHDVCAFGDVPEGTLKEFDVEGDNKILLAKEKGAVFCVSHKCTHYGAPLKGGVLSNGRVRCPWHGACFNVKSGDIEDYPGVDSLSTFPVRVENDRVIVSLDASNFPPAKRARVASCAVTSKEHVVIVGGGPAGATCADVLRQQGFSGRITMYCKESVLPYDRPKLSKAMSVTAAGIALHTEEYYTNLNITVRLGTEVTAVLAAEKVVVTATGEREAYDKVFVAPGGAPRKLPVEGVDLANIFCLRNPAEANAINEKATEGANVVVVGSSFVGMEVAACLAMKTPAPKSITVVGMEKVPFERVLGEKVFIYGKATHHTTTMCNTNQNHHGYTLHCPF
eukprot:NODE_972_length_1194_cov_77.732751_g734_i0.p1 GENE.NODE_972_length_1194_cov_77.732751_g734_i0~~NODE_972_length_1194_cov_77.732751_g734_i0.p1  ORF type:complete len:358 (-),score=101.59 NODE_972_length_1194_cov_77.732751_g734_i0:119-1138(-)